VEEVEILKRRAEAFFRHAKEAIEREEYDFACFSSEQAAQLAVKSTMLRLIGEIPRLHRIRELLHLLGTSVKKSEKAIHRFVSGNSEGLRALEDSYITSRYIPTSYTREEAEALLKLAKQIIELMERVLKSCQL
jgi:HEPN domain-containing protein